MQESGSACSAETIKMYVYLLFYRWIGQKLVSPNYDNHNSYWNLQLIICILTTV